MHVEESKENYLETRLLLKRKKAYVRSVDVAEAMGFSKPSISRAMGILKEAGYVTIEPDGNIQLTESGRQRAESVYERHRLITDFLVETVGADPAIAEQDACKIEHIISPEVFAGIKAYLRK